MSCSCCHYSPLRCYPLKDSGNAKKADFAKRKKKNRKKRGSSMKRVLQRVPFGKGAHAYTGPSSTQWRNFDNEAERETEDDDYLYRYGLFFSFPFRSKNILCSVDDDTIEIAPAEVEKRIKTQDPMPKPVVLLEPAGSNENSSASSFPTPMPSHQGNYGSALLRNSSLEKSGESTSCVGNAGVVQECEEQPGTTYLFYGSIAAVVLLVVATTWWVSRK